MKSSREGAVLTLAISNLEESLGINLEAIQQTKHSERERIWVSMKRLILESSETFQGL